MSEPRAVRQKLQDLRHEESVLDEEYKQRKADIYRRQFEVIASCKHEMRFTLIGMACMYCGYQND